MLIYWCPKPAPSPRYLCKKLLLLKVPVGIVFHNKFQLGQYSLKYKKMSTNSACLIGKREETSCSSTNLGILSHESIIQIIAFIPASLRMRKTNHRDWERIQEDLGALIRQNVWEPKDREIRQKGHECSLGRKDRCPQMCLCYSHGSDLIKQEGEPGVAPWCCVGVSDSWRSRRTNTAWWEHLPGPHPPFSSSSSTPMSSQPADLSLPNWQLYADQLCHIGAGKRGESRDPGANSGGLRSTQKCPVPHQHQEGRTEGTGIPKCGKMGYFSLIC